MTLPAGGPAAAGAPRWVALDALRGLAIAAMILVNNPGSWDHVYAPLRHAAWHGCTFTDLVFPTFLFAVGAAIVPSQAAALRRGRTARQVLGRIVRRSLVLVLLGLLLAAFPLVSLGAGGMDFAPLAGARLPGVLQRIGVCYCIAALLHLFATPRTERWVIVACLLAYWPVLALVPVPGGGAADLDSTGGHLAGWLDRTVFGSRTWQGRDYDPEGILSTVPTVATTLLGVAAGRVLAGGAGAAGTGGVGSLRDRVLSLFARGALLTAGGLVWGWFFPINKALWTSSYAVFTAGAAMLGLALCAWAFELRSWGRWARPLEIYGRNALLVFVGSGLLARVVGRLWTVPDGDGGRIPVKAWFHREVLAGWLPPELASLVYALLWVGGWFLVLLALWRRGIVWKV